MSAIAQRPRQCRCQRCAGCPNSVANGRSTRIVSPLASRITRGWAANVTSSQSTCPAMDRASSSGYRSPPPNRPASPNGVGATWTTRMLTIALLTLGDPGRLTGGYLYHRRMADAAERHDAKVLFGSFPDHPFPPRRCARRRWSARCGDRGRRRARRQHRGCVPGPVAGHAPARSSACRQHSPAAGWHRLRADRRKCRQSSTGPHTAGAPSARRERRLAETFVASGFADGQVARRGARADVAACVPPTGRGPAGRPACCVALRRELGSAQGLARRSRGGGRAAVGHRRSCTSSGTTRRLRVRQAGACAACSRAI